MAKYQLKPIVVEAEQWFPPDILAEKNVYIEGISLAYKYPALECKYCKKPLNTHGIMGAVVENLPLLCPGDWIITLENGEKSICKPDGFLQTFESVDNHELSDREAVSMLKRLEDGGWLD